MGGLIIEDATLCAVLKLLKEEGVDLNKLQNKYAHRLMNNEIPMIPEDYREESLIILRNAIDNI
ncbi:TPA: hypothetical protein ACSI5E_003159 [Acinetobacter baumannii]